MLAGESIESLDTKSAAAERFRLVVVAGQVIKSLVVIEFVGIPGTE